MTFPAMLTCASTTEEQSLNCVKKTFSRVPVRLIYTWDLHKLHNDLTTLTLSFGKEERIKGIWQEFLEKINGHEIFIKERNGVVHLETTKELKLLKGEKPNACSIRVEVLDPQAKNFENDFQPLAKLFYEGFPISSKKGELEKMMAEQRTMLKHNPNRCKMFVAKTGDETVGMALSISFAFPPTPPEAATTMIFNVARKADAAFLQVGEQLMREVTKEPGIYRLYVIRQDLPAINIYKKIGFSQIDTNWIAPKRWAFYAFNRIALGDVIWMEYKKARAKL